MDECPQYMHQLLGAMCAILFCWHINQGLSKGYHINEPAAISRQSLAAAAAILLSWELAIVRNPLDRMQPASRPFIQLVALRISPRLVSSRSLVASLEFKVFGGHQREKENLAAPKELPAEDTCSLVCLLSAKG